MNLFYDIFPDTKAEGKTLSCEADVSEGQPWPPVPGEYFVLGENKSRHVTVSTLASISLAEELARLAPKNLCLVGKTETENIGIEKVIKNSITNPSIHHLIVSGKDPDGHRSGATLLSLCKKGVDEKMRVIGSPGKRPVLNNVTPEEVEAFRRQIGVIDMIGCENASEIIRRIDSLSADKHHSCSGMDFAQVIKPVEISKVDVIHASPAQKAELDKTGYFVVLPLKEKGQLRIEHYSNKNRLLRIIEGNDAASIYKTIIESGWITQLSHAAYLGKELERAELSMRLNFKYVQDGI